MDIVKLSLQYFNGLNRNCGVVVIVVVAAVVEGGVTVPEIMLCITISVGTLIPLQ
jgi:hypothetical protein